MLREEIESIRGILNRIILVDDSEKILEISRRLDELINRYYSEVYGCK